MIEPSKSSSYKDHESKLLCTFGIIADVQYGDIDDVICYGRKRYYRGSLTSVTRAINDWKLYETKNDRKISFILQLGDIIEGFRVKKLEDKIENMFRVLKEMELLFPSHDFKAEYSFINSDEPPKIFHIIGNHEPYGLLRKNLVNSPLNTSKILKQNQVNDANYYYYDITENLRLVCLDLYEKSLLGYDENSQLLLEAKEILKINNELKEKCQSVSEKDYYERFANHGGAASETQLRWLSEQLKECKSKNKRVILTGHIPIKREAANFHLAWNSDDILNLIWSYENTVIVYLSGHYHVGGYFLDEHNVHHLTVSAILETPQELNSYVTVEVFEDKIRFENKSSYIGNLGSFTVNLF